MLRCTLIDESLMPTGLPVYWAACLLGCLFTGLQHSRVVFRKRPLDFVLLVQAFLAFRALLLKERA